MYEFILVDGLPLIISCSMIVKDIFVKKNVAIEIEDIKDILYTLKDRFALRNRIGRSGELRDEDFLGNYLNQLRIAKEKYPCY